MVLAAAGVAAAGSIAGSAISGGAAKSAANTQADAASQAEQQQAALQQQLIARSQPFVDQGAGKVAGLDASTNALLAQLGLGPGGTGQGPLNKPFNPTMADLQATPGYQFSLDQGLKATQNGYAAQGLGSSGAAQKGATSFAEGLAGTTFQNQFQNYLAQQLQQYNLLSGGIGQQFNQVGLGANTAVGSGSALVGGQSAISNLLVGQGNALAAGTVGVANAASAGLGGLGQNALLGALFANQNPSGLGGNPFGGSGSGQFNPSDFNALFPVGGQQ